jgi:hypothetical protein
MKSVILALLFTLTTPAFADDGLITVPDGAKEEEPKQTGGPLYEQGSIPASGTQEEYVTWAKKLLEAGRKNMLSDAAYKTGVKVGTRCLWFPGAFGFQRSSANQYTLNCFAGSARSITHIAFYKMNFSYGPAANCADDEKIRDWFKAEGLRNQTGALQFINMINNTCQLKVEHADAQRPVVRAVQMSADDVKKELEKPEREALRSYVNRGKEQKHGAQPDDGSTQNPLRGGSDPQHAK